MTTDREPALMGRLWGHPGAGGAYHGFSAAPSRPGRAERAVRAWKAPRAATIAAGVGGALALGLAFGFLAKPDLGHSHMGEPMRAVTPAAAAPQPAVAIQVNAPRPPLPVKSAGKLEVLPPDMARNAQRAIPTYVALAPAPSLPVTTQPYARPAGGLDPACAGAQGRGAQLVCADPDLAAADRELNRAYRRALRSGVQPDQLRQEQRDWLAIREDAARRSPRAVADIYEQRINELNDLADEGPG